MIYSLSGVGTIIYRFCVCATGAFIPGTCAIRVDMLIDENLCEPIQLFPITIIVILREQVDDLFLAILAIR